MSEKQELTAIASCGNGECPAVYRTDRGTLVIQGSIFEYQGVPAGEAMVEIPASLIMNISKSELESA